MTKTVPTSDAARAERMSFLRTSAIPGTEMLAVYHSLRSWHFFHERYAICACRFASAGWRYRGKQEFSNDGDVMLLEPGEVHCNTSVQKHSEFKVLFIDPSLFKRTVVELGGSREWPHFRIGHVDDPLLFAAIYSMCASAEAGALVLEQQARFAECTRLLLNYVEHWPHRVDRLRPQSAVSRAKDYLRAQFREAVTLDELAAMSGLSRFHLAHAFTAQVGLAPHAYQLHVRIEHARNLIQNGASAVNAAAQVGFSDQSHFTRHFKRIMHVTPGEYSRAAR